MPGERGRPASWRRPPGRRTPPHCPVPMVHHRRRCIRLISRRIWTRERHRCYCYCYCCCRRWPVADLLAPRLVVAEVHPSSEEGHRYRRCCRCCRSYWTGHPDTTCAAFSTSVRHYYDYVPIGESKGQEFWTRPARRRRLAGPGRPLGRQPSSRSSWLAIARSQDLGARLCLQHVTSLFHTLLFASIAPGFFISNDMNQSNRMNRIFLEAAATLGE